MQYVCDRPLVFPVSTGCHMRVYSRGEASVTLDYCADLDLVLFAASIGVAARLRVRDLVHYVDSDMLHGMHTVPYYIMYLGGK